MRERMFAGRVARCLARPQTRAIGGTAGAAAAAAVAAGACLFGSDERGLCGCEGVDFESAPAIPNPFYHQTLINAFPQRLASEQQLRSYMQLAQSRLQDLYNEAPKYSRQAFNEKLLALRERINLDTQIIIYGTAERHARQQYLEKYGCVRWTDEALSLVASFAPLIEIGAGQGHWAKALREQGADVLAFDNNSTEQPGREPVTQVRFGDHTKLPWYPQRTLLLVYPPETDMALECAKTYQGDYLVYVGEARGGVNATDAFFDYLEDQFECVKIQDLDPFPRCYERLYLMRRKPEHRQRKPWWTPLASLW